MKMAQEFEIVWLSTFSLAHVTQDSIISAVNKYNKQTSSKVISQEKHTKYSAT